MNINPPLNKFEKNESLIDLKIDLNKEFAILLLFYCYPFIFLSTFLHSIISIVVDTYCVKNNFF